MELNDFLCYNIIYMNIDSKKFENTVLFRLIRVLYVIGLLSLFVLALLVAKRKIPIKVIDSENSYVECEDGTKYSFETLGIEDADIRYHVSDGWGDKKGNGRKVWDVCKDKTDKFYLRKGFSIGDTLTVLDSEIPNPDYDIFRFYKLDKSWLEPIGVFLAVFLGGFIFLNIVKKILFYIFFGKPLIEFNRPDSFKKRKFNLFKKNT